MKFNYYLAFILMHFLVIGCVSHSKNDVLCSLSETQKLNYYEISKAELSSKYPKYFTNQMSKSIYCSHITSGKIISLYLREVVYANENSQSGVFSINSITINMSESGDILEVIERRSGGADFTVE